MEEDQVEEETEEGIANDQAIVDSDTMGPYTINNLFSTTGDEDDSHNGSFAAEFASAVSAINTRTAGRTKSCSKTTETDKRSEFRKRSCNFEETNEILRPNMRRAFVLVCNVGCTLTRVTLWKLFKLLKLNVKGQEEKVTKVYCKIHNIVMGVFWA